MSTSRSSGVMDLDELSERAFAILNEWDGYPIMRRVLVEVDHCGCYLIGGVLRNIILGLRAMPKDFDFVLVGPGSQRAISRFATVGSMGVGPLGSSRWSLGAHSKQYCDLVSLEKFDQGFGKCEDIYCILNQFDFSGNALALDLGTGRILNPHNGIRDLGCRLMRAIRFDHPVKPIAPGQPLTWRALVWFRILHYAALLNLTIDAETLEWLRRNLKCKDEYNFFVSVFFAPHPKSFHMLGLFDAL